MTDTDRRELDPAVRTLCDQGDYRAAATAIILALGGDVVRLIHARFRDETSTAEVFSSFAEALWVGLPGFAFRCSVEAWVFTLARNAGSRYLARDLRRQRRGVPLSQVSPLAGELAEVQTRTLADLRSEHTSRLAELRKHLDEEEQLVLTLRIDRRLDWREIALVTLGDAEAAPALVTREASRLRKRFQLLKAKLRRALDAARDA
jgi:RNA polymerase sigma-70 factor (ECF subfamily)